MANADMVTQAITRQGPGPRTQNCGMKAQTACGGHSAGQAMEPRLGQNGGAIATKLHSQPPVETTGRTTGRGPRLPLPWSTSLTTGLFVLSVAHAGWRPRRGSDEDCSAVTLRYFAWPFQAERSMMAAGKHTSITHGCRKLHPNSLVTSPSGTCLEQSGIQVLCHLDEWDLGAFLMAASGAPQLGGHANLHDTRLPNETTRRSHSQLHRLFFFPPL